jgi:hypothetical protein
MTPNTPTGQSPFERLRLQGAVRATVIGYGVAIMTVLLNRGGGESESPWSSLFYMVASGLALQGLLYGVRVLARRYERAAGLAPGYLAPLAIYILELAVDAVTVFLFALATFRGILQVTAGV